MCKVLQVSSGSYYRRKKQTITAKRQRYGSPRITLELRSFGYKILTPKSFARIGEAITLVKYMKQLGLQSKLSKKFKITTNLNHNYLLIENIVKREFIVKMPSKEWVSDSTYSQTKEGFVYLTTIMDLHHRKIISWSLSDGMSTDDPSDSEQAKQSKVGAGKMAVKNRDIVDGLIFHSDTGVQYASKKFLNCLMPIKK